MKNILITGHKSGLGKYIYNNLKKKYEVKGLTRSNFKIIKNFSYDLIIHCAAKRPIYGGSNNILEYYKDNILLTEKITDLSFGRIIYISTIDVYEKSVNQKKENIEINPNFLTGIYPISKLISENIIKEKTKNFLILRLPSIIGSGTKKGSIYNLLRKKNNIISYSKESNFNIVDYSTILNIILYTFKKKIIGIFNVASKKNINIKNIIGKNFKNYGKYNYQVGKIDINKLKKINIKFIENTDQVIKKYIKIK